jgi:hypothetical protein
MVGRFCFVPQSAKCRLLENSWLAVAISSPLSVLQRFDLKSYGVGKR